jgi:hypothetical protein
VPPLVTKPRCGAPHCPATRRGAAAAAHLSIGQLKGLLQSGAGQAGLQLALVVHCHIAQLLLNVAHNFLFGGGGERVAPLGEDAEHPLGKVASGEVQALDSVRQREAARGA